MAKVSVVIPFYNISKEYFDVCMESVAGQTYADFEVILVDDGSRPEGAAMCDEWARRDGRVRVIHQPNGGVSRARNNGIEKASGQWIIFLDPDDWWEKDTLEVLTRIMEREKTQVLRFGYCDNYDDKQLKSSLLPEGEEFRRVDQALKENIQLGLLDENVRKIKGCTGSPCFQLIERALLTENNLRFPEGIYLSEDMLFDLALYDGARSIGLAAGTFYHYRHHALSASYRYDPQVFNQREMVNEAIHAYIAGNGGRDRQDRFLQCFAYKMMRNYIDVLIQMLFHPDNPQSPAERRAQWLQIAKRSTYASYMRLKDCAYLFRRKKLFGLMAFFSFILPNYAVTRKLYDSLKTRHAYYFSVK